MSSPSRYSPQRRLNQSPLHRSRSPSPSRNDIDFLHRKIQRLEVDNHQACQELHRVRNRLRKAEDYEIKYDLIQKQKAILESELNKKQRLLHQQSLKNKQLSLICVEKQKYQLGFKVERDNLLQQIQRWRSKAIQNEQDLSSFRAQQQYKLAEKLDNQLEYLKKTFLDKQQNFRAKIRMLEIELSEKHVVQQTLKTTQQSSSKEKGQQIERLRGIISQMRDDHLSQIQQKNQQILAIGKKFETLFTFEVEKLKKNQQNNSQKFSVQVEGLRSMFQLKNQQIEQILAQNANQRKSHLQQKGQLQKQLSLLKERIYQRQRQNELQIHNLKERLISLHREDINQLKANHQKLNLNLEENNRQLQDLLRQKQEEIVKIHKRAEDQIKELDKLIEDKNKNIQELNQRLRHTGNMNTNEINNLHSSFHKITTQKELLSTEYQSTFSFLNNQISKLSQSNQLKNQEIKDLHLQIAEIKKNSNQHIKDLQQKWKTERKSRQQERDRQRNIRQQQENQFRQKQQNWRHRERMLERQKQKEERQKIKQKITIAELQKNVQRLNRHIRQNQERLKHEMHRNQSSFIETGTIRRQLTSQLQRQKGQLDSMKLMQLDQVQRKFQIEITRLTNENQRLLNELNELKINFDRVEQECKKAQVTKKNLDRRNKEKMVQYQRKMAALNSQINITQNLYQSFINAKSKVSERK